MPDLSVVICTWNRASVLDETLESLCALESPKGVAWELIIVNNHSTDDTDAVIARYQERLPLCRLFEPEMGLSLARNRALAAAQGDLIVFVDDDVKVRPTLLQEYWAAAQRWPEALAFGGRILPLYVEPPPQWFTDNLHILHGIISIRDLPMAEGPFPAPEFPYGANMAFRPAAFACWHFDPRLGLHGADQIQSEEQQLFQQLHDAGTPPIWVPKAELYHRVEPYRCTRQFVWKRLFGFGRSLVRSGQHEPWLDLVRRSRRQVWQTHCHIWWKRLRGQADWVAWYTNLAVCCGIQAELKAASLHF